MTSTSDPLSSFGSTLSGMLKEKNVNSVAQKHLLNVYTTLAAGVGAAAVACYASMAMGWGMNFNSSLLFSLIGMGVIWYMRSLRTPKEKFPYFLGFCGIQGASLSSLVSYSLYISPGAVLNALCATCIVFLCFSGFVLFSKNRSFYLWGGTLASVMSVLAWASFANIFFRSSWLLDLNIYVGLLAFVAYIVIDTERIISDAGYSRDYVDHALQLFIDLKAVFSRILIILARKKKQDERRRNDRRRRDRRRY